MNAKSKFLICIISSIVILTNFVFATNTDRSKLQQTKKERRQVQQQINQKKREINSITRNISNIENQISFSENKLSDLEKQIKNLKINIEQTKKNIEKTKKEIAEKEELLKERIRLMYKTSDISYLQLLIESKNISELISNSYNVQQILNADKELLEQLANKREELETYQIKLDKEMKRLTVIQEKIKVEQVQLQGYIVDQKNAKNSISKDLNSLIAREDQLKKESNSLEQKILAAMKASGSNNKPYSGGALAWPLSIRGTITSGYGYRTSPITGRREFHLGVDIAAPRGTAVVAAADGTVITSRYQYSYGNVVMIDHGGGISTVYAHNSALVVRAGASVKKGQTIAKVGSTGHSTGNHLHFEVRVNGKTTNPMGYYK